MTAMLYSPKPHLSYLCGLKGPGAGLLCTPRWNLAWLTLPGIDTVPAREWVKHPMEDSIQGCVWTELYHALHKDYPLAAVQLILDEGIDRIMLCEHWERDTCDTMLARAKESERRLRIADGTLPIPRNVVYVDFGARKIA